MSLLMILSALFMPSEIVTESVINVDSIQVEVNEVMLIARNYNPDKFVALAIVRASRKYGVDRRTLAAIAIIESSFGSNAITRMNENGTTDSGVFQINTINIQKCLDLNLTSVQGSAYCAARILSDLKVHYPLDYHGCFHSKTPNRKHAYMLKINKILNRSIRGLASVQ